VDRPDDFEVIAMSLHRCAFSASTPPAKRWCNKNMFFSGLVDIDRRRAKNIVFALRAEGFQLPSITDGIAGDGRPAATADHAVQPGPETKTLRAPRTTTRGKCATDFAKTPVGEWS
jgi:hypothetical protein